MKKKIITLVVILMLAMPLMVTLTGCASDAASQNTTSIIVIVNDSEGAPLRGASVSVAGSTATRTTDANGAATFSNKGPGVHIVTIRHAVFADIRVAAIVSLAGLINPFPVAEPVIVYLSELGSSVTGRATIIKDGITTPAANKEIMLNLTPWGDFDYQFLDSRFTTTTDSNGFYTFNNLPANVRFSVTGVTTEADGISFNANSRSATTDQPWNAPVQITQNIEFTPAVGQFRLTSFSTVNLQNDTDGVEISFSAPVRIGAAHIIAEMRTSPWAAIPVNIAWSNGNQTATVTPVVGRWTSHSDIFVSVASVSGLTLNNVNVRVNLPAAAQDTVPSNVGEVTLCADTNIHDVSLSTFDRHTFALNFNVVEDATGYHVFARRVGEDSFFLTQNNFIFDVFDSTVEVTTQTSGNLTVLRNAFDQGAVEFFVFAQRNGVRSNVASSLVVAPINVPPVV